MKKTSILKVEGHDGKKIALVIVSEGKVHVMTGYVVDNRVFILTRDAVAVYPEMRLLKYISANKCSSRP